MCIKTVTYDTSFINLFTATCFGSNFSCIKFYKRPDDGSQLQPKHVAVNKLIKLMYMTVFIHILVIRGFFPSPLC